MKILIHSNAPWVASGYGEQCRLLSERLSVDHDVGISAYYGLQGSVLDWNDCMVYPGGNHSFGADVIRAHSEHHFANERGLILTLLDVWVLRPQDLKSLPVASWVPLDHMNMQPVIREYFTVSEAVPITMSKHGQNLMEKEGFSSLYIPHGIDTSVFKPLDRVTCRDELNIPSDAFVVGMVAANQGTPARKGFAEAFSALARFMERHSDAVLYLHTDTDGSRGQGVDLIRLVKSCGLPNDRIIEVDQYLYRMGMLSPNYMARIYNSIDVLLNPSYGEGFGIPIIEAQACGTPVIATNVSAMSELTSCGWLVDGQPFYTGLQEFQMIPDVGEIEACLSMAYESGGGHRQEARDFAVQYDADTVFSEYWRDALDTINSRLRSKQIMELVPESL